MNTQRVEGHTPIGIRIAEWCADNAAIAANPKTPLGAQLEIAYKLLREQSDNIERLEKVNEALVRALEPFAEKHADLTNAVCHRGICSAERCGRCSKVIAARAALSLAKEPA